MEYNWRELTTGAGAKATFKEVGYPEVETRAQALELVNRWNRLSAQQIAVGDKPHYIYWLD